MHPLPVRHAAPDLPLPTEGELRILRVLWDAERAPCARCSTRCPGEDTGYTTVLKLLQIMYTKGLVIRDERERTHVYAAAVPPETTQRQLLADFTEKAFGGLGAGAGDARALARSLVAAGAGGDQADGGAAPGPEGE
jgi:predicted transcriptional regulator